MKKALFHTCRLLGKYHRFPGIAYLSVVNRTLLWENIRVSSETGIGYWKENEHMDSEARKT